MSSDLYAQEKLSNAVGALACGTGTIQQRLLNAFTAMHTLAFSHNLSNPERQAELNSIFERMLADKSDPDKGHAATTILALSDEKAQELATAVWELDGMLKSDALFAAEDGS